MEPETVLIPGLDRGRLAEDGPLTGAAAPLVDTAGRTAIEVSGLRKRFGDNLAVSDLNLTVREGEIFGLVGPDGAGKTTTFRLLLGLLTPEAGTIRIGGYEVPRQSRDVRDLVGYVPQAFTLYGDLSIAENIRFNADLRGLSAREAAERSGQLLEVTDLARFTDRLAGNLSGGMRRKLALICAMLHGPRILLLDEPTTGIDPVSRRDFWQLLYALPAQGVTLLVSTPFLDEAERCHRLGLMAEGRMLALDTPKAMLLRMPDALVEIRTDSRREARRMLQKRPEVRRVETVGGSLLVAFDPKEPGLDDGRAYAGLLAAAGVDIQSCEPAEATLADVFSALSEAPGGAA
jgi:ABC-2 type transport system ATP-binding protein